MSTSYKNRWLIVSFLTLFLALSLLVPTKAYFLNVNKPITQGSNGYSCIYLLTFKHDSLLPYLKSAESKKGLYLIDLPFLERNEDVIELLIAQNHAIGFISSSIQDEQFHQATFQKELQLFTEKIGSTPLWITTANGEFNEELLKASYKAGINIIAASTYFHPSLETKELPKGSFVFIKGDKNFDFLAKEHIQLVTSSQIRTIEENVFNIKTKEKNIP